MTTMKRLTALIAALLLLTVPSTAQLRKYDQGTTIYFPLVELAGVNFATTGVSCATGDVKISKNGGAPTNATNCFDQGGVGNPLAGTGIYRQQLTSTEMQGAEIVIVIKDQTNPKVWLDDAIVIDTYGNVLAQHPMDFGSVAFLQSQLSIYRGTINADDFGPTLTQFEADIIDGSGAAADLSSPAVPDGANRINNAVIIFTSGALSGTRRTIADFAMANGRGFFTVTQLSEPAAAGDQFVIM